MNLFSGLGNFGHSGNGNCVCSLIWLMFLLSMCGCDTNGMFGGDCSNLIVLLLLLSYCSNGCGSTPCGN